MLSVVNQTQILYILLLYQQQKFCKVRRKRSIEKLDRFEMSRAEKGYRKVANLLFRRKGLSKYSTKMSYKFLLSTTQLI